MQVVLQRVLSATARRDGEVVGTIGPGLLALVGFDRSDTPDSVAWMARKIANVRVFPEGESLFGRSAIEEGAAVFTLSQFALAADTSRGRRPNFSRAAAPDVAREWYAMLGDGLEAQGVSVVRGPFRTHLLVETVNWGPFTMVLQR